MRGSYWTDSHEIKAKCKILKQLIKIQKETEIGIEKLQTKLDTINWTDDNKEERLRLYKELGEITETYRNNRIRVKWSKEKNLKSNITG